MAGQLVDGTLLVFNEAKTELHPGGLANQCMRCRVIRVIRNRPLQVFMSCDQVVGPGGEDALMGRHDRTPGFDALYAAQTELSLFTIGKLCM